MVLDPKSLENVFLMDGWIARGQVIEQVMQCKYFGVNFDHSLD